MDEKEVRLDEVEKLKENVDGHGFSEDHVIRRFIERRIKAIHDMFAPKEEPAQEAAPAEEVAPAEQPAPAEEPSTAGQTY